MAFLDGGVRFLRNAISDSTRIAIGTYAGGEVVDLDK
jgi:hypothetical protein